MDNKSRVAASVSEEQIKTDTTDIEGTTDINKKSALITGASRGIGRACAYVLAEAGYDLYLTCLKNRDALEVVKTEVEEKYEIKCRIFCCDGGDYGQVKELMAGIVCPDVLVNNAGISFMGLITDMSVDQWLHIINTNLNSMFYFCREAVPAMIRRQAGKIINVSSVWGETGASMEVAYSTAKAGVNGFTRALAKELAPGNIQVNGIAFGLVDTDMNQCLTKDEWEDVLEEIPAGRACTPLEAAHMVLQIINSPAYLTGQIIKIDGGWK